VLASHLFKSCFQVLQLLLLRLKQPLSTNIPSGVVIHRQRNVIASGSIFDNLLFPERSALVHTILHESQQEEFEIAAERVKVE
jgi:hypothetical protein